jgi:N-acetylneuraminic acid mutarotase
MKKQIGPSVKAHLLRSTFYLLLILSAGATPFALSQRQPGKQRTLTFAERIAYQRAIEEVYWHHRIWPKERPEPKPSLDAVMSQAQLEKKVEDYLRKSQALEDYWQRPLTAEQLQAEMDRMAQHTKQPEVLQDLFDALGNDPFVIAECLVRPVLAERLLRSWYAYDQRFHGDLKHTAEAELQAHNSIDAMRETNRKYSETEFVRSDGGPNENNLNAEHSVKLNSREWDEIVQKLAVTFSKSEIQPSNGRDGSLSPPSRSARPVVAPYPTLPVGKLSSLQQDEERYYATVVLSKTNDRLRFATIEWSKVPWESWLATVESQVANGKATPDDGYRLPKIADDGSECIDDTWMAIAANVPLGRESHTAVWTGSEMIIWGGFGQRGQSNTGSRYNPATDSWLATSTTNVPTARDYHTAVWTGTDMIIWGGLDNNEFLNTGGRYNPNTDSWTPTSLANAPSGRSGHTVVWAGGEMIVWGGVGQGVELNTSGRSTPNSVFGPPPPTPTPTPPPIHYLNSGGRYNPRTDSWTTTNVADAPSGRVFHTAISTGTEMIVWGGTDSVTYFNTGGRYNPDTDSWTATSTTNTPTSREIHTGIWTGSEMIVWGGDNGPFGYLNTGGKYNPNADTWTATSTTNAPGARNWHTVVWTGTEMIVWGGIDSNNTLNTGGKYIPGTNSWTPTNMTNAPARRGYHTAVWTGSEMIIWGGTGTTYSNTGGRYNPSTDSWVPTADTIQERWGHSAVWTGNEMIVWGGGFGDFDTGGRYTPSTDTWTATSTANAPTGREAHTAIWTGNEMIVWGGRDYNLVYLRTGGRYNPQADSWTATSIADAPDSRQNHTAVWTGSQMIVWGGYFFAGGDHYLDTGGRYDPSTDSWTATSIINAPAGRAFDTAVWTGNEMIVWGGYFDVANQGRVFLNTGGRYDPGTDTWTDTSIINAPTERAVHAAVWTDKEMIVWGGATANGVLNTGGRYDPSTDTWTPVSLATAPDSRSYNKAVWTGSEMITWGGFDASSSHLNTGGRYDPGADSWTPTSIIDAPIGRGYHTTVWTGSEMIVWGGYNNPDGALSTGGIYCAQSGPTATPSPTATPRPTPTPRPRPSPRYRPQLDLGWINRSALRTR